MKELHVRRIDWLRSCVAVVTLTLLGLVVYAVLNEKVGDVDVRWLWGALAATSLAYPLRGWTRRSPEPR